MKTIVKSTLNTADLDRLSINTIRFLSADAVQKANSGHPEWCGHGYIRSIFSRQI
jgi:hypothetical protein